MSVCSHKELCCAEIAEKLTAWGVDKNIIPEITDDLMSQNFIDHNRYALAYMRDKIRLNKWGLQKIRFMLHRKRIADNHINSAEQEIDQLEYMKIVEAEVLKKYKTDLQSTNLDHRTMQAKLLNWAQQRGYETDRVSQMFSRLVS